MKRNKKLTSLISVSLWLPILVVVCVLVIALKLMDINPMLAYVLCSGGVIYLVISIIYYELLEKRVSKELTKAGFQQSQVYKNMLKDLPVPYVLTTPGGDIFWYNDPFEAIVGEKALKKNISQIFASLHKKNFPPVQGNKTISVAHNDRTYAVDCRNIMILEEERDEIKGIDIPEFVRVFYFFDVTKVKELEETFEKKRMVVGLIYIDNYVEVLESMEEVRQSMLPALVERKIIKYFQPLDGIVKRFERDKFLFVVQEKHLEQLLNDKFSLLDEVRAINIGNELAMTLSISVGLNAPTYIETYDSARAAMDMALGRGGDQAVVKNGDNISYYGGKTQKVEKNTRVKARVKAHALHETMLAHDTVFIMGHKYPDADCFGAALGIYRLAKTFGKKAYIVTETAGPAIEPIVSRLPKPQADEEEIFLTPDEAIARKDTHCMLVIVDVNVPSMTESPALLKAIKTVVVLDHHRQSTETIKNAVLSYVEPYASSSCEMVAEILQYISVKPKLRPIEADALYSGILVDTDNFVIKAGVRTFEAAAYLRRMGADVTRVRKMFREDREDYMTRAEIIHNAEVYLDEFAIAEFRPVNPSGATVIGARAANELLNIQGIRGSFVITQLPETIYISARAIDDLNVQVIMEKMGGGGHLTVAAAQLKDKNLEEAKAILLDILTSMKEEGDI